LKASFKAAASILAKTHRDSYMKQLHKEFPHYNWRQNKGYGTLEHRKAIEDHGLCKYHRKSFAIDPKQFSLFDEANADHVEFFSDENVDLTNYSQTGIIEANSNQVQ
jgi:ribonuclease HII